MLGVHILMPPLVSSCQSVTCLALLTLPNQRKLFCLRFMALPWDIPPTLVQNDSACPYKIANETETVLPTWNSHSKGERQ